MRRMAGTDQAHRRDHRFIWAGLALVIAGAFYLADVFGVLDVRWAIVAPMILLALGISLLSWLQLRHQRAH